MRHPTMDHLLSMIAVRWILLVINTRLLRYWNCFVKTRFVWFSGVGRFTPLIPGRQRTRPARGSGRRGRPPGSGKRARVLGSGPGRDSVPAKFNPESEVGFLSPEANRPSDVHSNNGIIFQLVNWIYVLWHIVIVFSTDDDTTPSSTQDPSPSGSSMKRKPGRPRLKPVGPAHQGSRKSSGEARSVKKSRRGAPLGPRVIKPLPVPIGSMSAKHSDPVRASLTATSHTINRQPGQGYYGSLSPWRNFELFCWNRFILGVQCVMCQCVIEIKKKGYFSFLLKDWKTFGYLINSWLSLCIQKWVDWTVTHGIIDANDN